MKTQIKQAKQKLEQFSIGADGPCPICRKYFKDNDCKHSIKEAEEFLKERILKLQIQEEVKKILDKASSSGML